VSALVHLIDIGGMKMKSRPVVFFTGVLIVMSTIMVGCTTTPKITDPPTPASGIIIGRITLTCKDFPGSWGVNGDHTRGIEISLRNLSTKEIVSVKSSGDDGFFYLITPSDESLMFWELRFVKKAARQTVTLPYRFEEIIGVGVRSSRVNNVGDIHWIERAETGESKEYSRKGLHTTLSAHSSYEFKLNFNEVANWFKAIFPDTAWNNKEWVSVAPLRWDEDTQAWIPLDEK
jgi:hypothetical protein